jgi:glucose-1-phosphate cytidylyltransferase
VRLAIALRNAFPQALLNGMQKTVRYGSLQFGVVEVIFPVGCNGLHRYNNDDHPMRTANAAGDIILGERKDKADIWSINVDDDYHERKRNPGDHVKAVILAGGFGTRLSEETVTRPKPMVEIGGKPLLWHIMKLYGCYGICDFVICLGYKGYLVKEYFANYFLHQSDVTIDLASNRMEVHQNQAEPWRVTLVDTGEQTMTGGRLKRIRSYLGDEDFCMTYGDGVGDVDIAALIAFHRSHGRLATVTAMQPAGRFGALELAADRVTGFREKPQGDDAWINGGFFVLSPRVLDYIGDDATPWEGAPVQRIAREDQLRAWFHRGFWQPLDTLRDKNNLEALWSGGNAPWKIWK